MKLHFRIISVFLSVLVLTSGCIGTTVGQTASAATAVAKVPFKIGGAVIDIATDDDEDKKNDEVR